MKKGLQRLIVSVICIALIMFPDVSVFATFDTTDVKEFNITVKDAYNIPVNKANVYLYSFEKEEIVIAGQTNELGICELTYLPKDNGVPEYIDYLIYVQKAGYSPQPYNLTKFYGDGETNDTHYDLVLQANPNYKMPSVTTHSKYATNSPFTVTRGECSNISPQSANATPTEGFSSHNIPLGTFHANKDSSLKVTFKTSDKVKVETGLSVNGTSFGIAGSRTRKFGTTTEFPTFSPTHYQKTSYYTRGRFETYYTTDSFSGTVCWYHSLDSISGGTVLGGVSSCSTCDGNWNTYYDGSGTAVPVSNGASWTVTYFRNKSTTLGSKISLAGYGFSGSVSVTRITGSETILKYTPRNGKDILVYDVDGSRSTWHVTSR